MKKYFVPICLMVTILSSCSKDEYVEIIEDEEQTLVDDDTNEADVDTETDTNNDLAVDSSILVLPDSPFNYANILLPNFFLDNDVRNEDNTPNNNQITDNGATLGRVLFYDNNLSRNNTIS